MTRTGDGPGGDEDGASLPEDLDTNPSFSALLEDSVEDLYENAPCGYVSTLMDGTIAKINTTLLDWLGYRRDELVGQRHFFDLLTVGGRMYYETHLAPMLSMHGQAGGLALELLRADGTRLPILLTSVVKTGPDGTAQLIRTTIFDATDRRATSRNCNGPATRPSTPARSPNTNTNVSRSWPPPCSAPCCHRSCPRFPGWRSRPTTTPPPPTMSAATSTTCFP
ncbi:PAS domain-containing protein [Nocardia salmonicida]|uniref:PAS domain-containing protein n=1 Tax=Nocardia salmonicida TaxID=53431 RepID=UPI00366D5278